MKVLLILILILISAGQISNPKGHSLVWSDEFERFDESKWNYEIGRRNDATNCKESVYIKDGNLVIRAFTKEGVHYSGIINSRDKFSFNKGYMEARIKFDGFSGSWSDIWLYNDNVAKDEENPDKNGIEIDITEYRVTDFAGRDISSTITHTTHYNGYGKYHKGDIFYSEDLGLNDGKFHIFGLLWDETGYTFFVDGKQTWKVFGPKTSANLFIVISTELASSMIDWTGKLPVSVDKETMLVDYVRVYQKK